MFEKTLVDDNDSNSHCHYETCPFIYRPYTEEEYEELLDYCRTNKLTIREYEDKLLWIRDEKD